TVSFCEACQLPCRDTTLQPVTFCEDFHWTAIFNLQFRRTRLHIGAHDCTFGAHDCTFGARGCTFDAHLPHPIVQEPQSGHFFSSDWFDVARSSAVWFGSGSEGRAVQKMHSRTTMRRLTPNQNLPGYDIYHRSPFYP